MRVLPIRALGRRETLKVMGAAALTTFCPVSPLSARQSPEANVKNFGAIGDGTRDDTRAFQKALRASNYIYIPAGTYAVKQIAVPGDKTIRTDGLNTKFRQIAGQPSGTALVVILGSNVALGSFSAEGNIATDSGEWMSALSVVANNVTGDISNVQVGDIVGTNLRGDVLYLGAKPGYALSNLRAGAITGNNVFRNVVSICGTGQNGGQINIGSVTGTAVGLLHFDIEPDSGDTPVVGVSVGTIRGRNVSVSGQAPEVYADAISIGSLDLSPDNSMGSVPDYPQTSFTRPHGLQIRNTKRLRIGTLKAQGFDGQAIKYVDSGLIGMAVDIDSCSIADCCRTNGGYCYIMGANDQAQIRISQLSVDLMRPNVSALLACNSCSIASISGAMAAGTRLINSCPGATIGNVALSGSSGNLAFNTSGATFAGIAGAFDAIGNNCDDLHFIDASLTGRFAGGSGDQQHILEKTTLNGTYYESDIYRPFA